MTSPDDDAAALIATLEDQERRLQFTHFDNDDAWTVGSLIVALAKERGLGVTVDIERNGQQLFHAALPGTTGDNDAWLARKNRVVKRYCASSYLVQQRMLARGFAFGPVLGVDPMDYAFGGGGFPVIIAGVGVVGAISVSGLAAADDHGLIVEVLEQFIADQ
jgi:uncharacterized protein (UPF0303 family)